MNVRFFAAMICTFVALALSAAPETVRIGPNGSFNVDYNGALATGAANLLTVDHREPVEESVLYSITQPGVLVRKIIYAPAGKVKFHTRMLIVLRPETNPAETLLVVRDYIGCAEPATLRWCVTTLAKPQNVGSYLMVRSDNGKAGGRMLFQMLLPGINGHSTELLGNALEADPGYRNVFTVTSPGLQHTVLVTMQIGALEAPMIFKSFTAGAVNHVINVAGYLISTNAGAGKLAGSFAVEVPADGTAYTLLLGDLAAGLWKVTSPDGKSETYDIDGAVPLQLVKAPTPGVWQVEKIK